MKKLIFTALIVFAPQMHAMQMDTAKASRKIDKKERPCLDTCCCAIKTCCYLCALCGVLTSAQPVNVPQAGNLAAEYAREAGQVGEAGNAGRMMGCNSVHTAFMVAGLAHGTPMISAEVNAHGLVDCYVQAAIESFPHEDYYEKALLLMELEKKIECAHLFIEEEADHKAWTDINAMQWAMFQTAEDRRAMQEKIKKRDAKRKECRQNYQEKEKKD